MRKTIICMLCIVMLLASLPVLSSCEKEIEDINGMTAEEAYTKAIKALEEIDKYSASASMSIKVKILGVPVYSIIVEDWCFYSYEGKNQHYGVTPEGKQKMIEEEIWDSSITEEMWYCDGIFYYIDGSYKGKYSSEICPIEKSEYEVAVRKMLDRVGEECKCFKKGDLYYFTVSITDSDLMPFDNEATKETYTVYLDEDGYIKTIEIENDYAGFMNPNSFVSVDYYYGDEARGVKLPEDLDSFVDELN